MSRRQSQIKTEDRAERGYGWVKLTQMPARVCKKELLGDCITRGSSAVRRSLSRPLIGRGRKEQRDRTSDLSSMFSLSIWFHNIHTLECLAMDSVLCLHGELANLL